MYKIKFCTIENKINNWYSEIVIANYCIQGENNMNNNEKVVYNASDIQKMLGMGRNRVYELLERVYKDNGPFIVLKFGKLYKIPKQPFDNWINGYQSLQEVMICQKMKQKK